MKITLGARTLALAALSAAAMPAAAQTVTAEENAAAVHAFMSAVDVGEIQMSALAQERAVTPDVREFAAAVVRDHSAALHAREVQVAEDGEGLFGQQLAGPAPTAGFTAAQMQALQGSLAQNPVSQPIAQAGAQNFQVLQGVTGPQFDPTYMDAQVAGHTYALSALDRMIAQGGVTDEMMETMRATRSTIAQHLERAQAIRGGL